MIKINVEYSGYSPEPPFNYVVLKTEVIEKENIDAAVMFLYEKADWETQRITYENGVYYLNTHPNSGDVVEVCYRVSE